MRISQWSSESEWVGQARLAKSYLQGLVIHYQLQMPKSYWYWAISQGVQAMNYIPCSVAGVSTTPHELTYGVKPDLCFLFRLFSVGFFHHGKDGPHHQSGISDSHSMQGIALG
jgi:hypothetical protein